MPGFDFSQTHTGQSVKLFDSTLVADAASIDTGAGGFSGEYDVLEVWIIARTDDAAATALLDIIFNNDTAGNYDWQRLSGTNTTVAAGVSGADTRIQVIVHGSGGSANEASSMWLTIPGYSQTTFHKSGVMQAALPDQTAANVDSRILTVQWRNTAAITRLKVAAQGAAKLKAGSRLLIYGR